MVDHTRCLILIKPTRVWSLVFFLLQLKEVVFPLYLVASLSAHLYCWSFCFSVVFVFSLVWLTTTKNLYIKRTKKYVFFQYKSKTNYINVRGVFEKSTQLSKSHQCQIKHNNNSLFFDSTPLLILIKCLWSKTTERIRELSGTSAS